MSQSRSHDPLKQLRLKKNPYVDRTAEKTKLDPASTYIPSDIFGFGPSSQTYIFFGKRGSGKTTIRMFMMGKHEEYNRAMRAAGKSRGLLVVDLTKPSTLTACLKAFQQNMGFTKESWDSQFSTGGWSSSDFADCVVYAAVTELLRKVTGSSSPSAPSAESDAGDAAAMLSALKADPRLARQFLVLAHVYAAQDPAQLALLRKELMPSNILPMVLGTVGGTLAGALASIYAGPAAEAIVTKTGLSSHVPSVEHLVPEVIRSHPKITATLTSIAAGSAFAGWKYVQIRRSAQRAAAVQKSVRVVAPPPSTSDLSDVLDSLFKSQETADSVRTLCVGTHGFQKLELLTQLARGLGYEDVALFMDGIDEVSLLDPVQYPAAIKAFASAVCRNEVLNHGRVHLFFPDSRQGLDLNTEKINREARFDRHHVRDLVWSRHQLEELAERRFRAAQMEPSYLQDSASSSADPAALTPPPKGSGGNPTFADLFRQVKIEDFSSFISKLSTPRELLITLTEILARAEASPDGTLTAQDMEIAVSKALEQSLA